MKGKIDSLKLIKIKKSCPGKVTVKRIKIQARYVFLKHIPDRNLVSKLYKELLKLNIKKINNIILKMGKRYHTGKDIWMSNKQ